MNAHQKTRSLVIVNIILIGVVLGVLLFIVGYVLSSARKAKRYVSSLADSFLPKLSLHEYRNIFYDTSQFDLTVLCKQNLSFFVACLMSSYNMAFGYSSYFPQNVCFKKKVGPTGMLINYKNWNIFCFRGTIEGKDIFTDIDSVQTNFIDLDGNLHEDLLVHRGFHSVWLSTIHDLNSCLTEKNCIFIGHSLGGTCAHLAACGMYLKTGRKCPVIVFGAPKVGNKKITDLVDTVSIMNENDFITSLPPPVFKVSEKPCFYSPYPRKYTFDVQSGNIFDNHSLCAYGYGIARKFISNIEIDIVW